jgi:xanthine dehydrogenase iron-sulfur cluster and FAD-binding subunit A
MSLWFCMPGMPAAAHALLTEEPDADKARLREVLRGDLWRGTGCIPIPEAAYEAPAAYRTWVKA